MEETPPRKRQSGLIDAPSFATKKHEASDDSEVEDLERGLEQVFIYEVPKNIRQGNPKAYTPLLISIGPILQVWVAWSSIKWIIKINFFNGLSFPRRHWSFIERNEKIILNCYEALIDEDEFIKMIFYDALFIVELFLRNYEKEVEKKSKIKDLLLKETWLAGLWRDLILLENQIPMFVLKQVYKSYHHYLIVSLTMSSVNSRYE